MISDELREQAVRVDLIEIARRFVELRRESAREYSGPCPKCGGDDRFHVSADGWFFCRQCHEDRGDSIEFVRWVDGLTFEQAVQRLTGQGVVVRSIVQSSVKHRSSMQTAGWAHTAEARLKAAQTALLDQVAGQPGREYLTRRGLLPVTWEAFNLGFRVDAPLPGTLGKLRAAAVVIPWFVAGRLAALRYRFLEAQTYIDADDKERKDVRLAAESGSQFAGRMFGGQNVLLDAAPRRTLVICEGEINAMSIWQAANDSHVDVLSVGSESAGVTRNAAGKLAAYRRVIVWLDDPQKAQQAASMFTGAFVLCNPNKQHGDTNGDANDLLRAGVLDGFLSLARERAAGDNRDELRALLWSLYDSAMTGCDEHTAKSIVALSDRLGETVSIECTRDGLYMTV